MFIGLTNFFDQSGPAVYFRHGNSLKCPRTITPLTLDFAGKLTFVHGVISILSATQTDCLKKKKSMSICFSAEKKNFRDFRFSFPRKSSFPRRIPGSAEGTPCLYHACAKEDGGLAGGSAVKCRKAIFAYVAKRKSSSRTLYTC